jgi:hypothetical protein
MTANKTEWRSIDYLRIKDLYEPVKDMLRIELQKTNNGHYRGDVVKFSKIGQLFWKEVIRRIIEEGEDIKIPKFGTLGVRRRKSTKIYESVYGHNFNFVSKINGKEIKVDGKRYTDLDLINNFNSYPAFFWWNNAAKKYRSVYWKYFIRLRLRNRRDMWEGFFDKRYDYKTISLPSPYEKKGRKKNKMWRNGMLLTIKEKL